jgi:hypothetical protein
MDHPNGALGVTEIVMVHPEPQLLAEAHARLVGPHRVQVTKEGIEAQWGSITFHILSPDGVTDRYPGVVMPITPPAGSLVGATVVVASLPATAAILQHGGIATAKTPLGGIVPLGEAPVGTILEFREG